MANVGGKAWSPPREAVGLQNMTYVENWSAMADQIKLAYAVVNSDVPNTLSQQQRSALERIGRGGIAVVTYAFDDIRRGYYYYYLPAEAPETPVLDRFAGLDFD
jgi:hypothetical protein